MDRSLVRDSNDPKKPARRRWGKQHSRQTEGQAQVCEGGNEGGMFPKRKTTGEASAQQLRKEEERR